MKIDIDERPILFRPQLVKAILEGRKTRGKLYLRRGEDTTAPEHIARRLANGLDAVPDSGCWIWKRTARETGHGTMTVRGRSISVHRLAYELGIEPIPKGMWVLHRCDNPRCIRPDHLELGDQSKNMADCAARGRTAKGECNGMAKLTRRDVNQIRRLGKSGLTQDSMAEQFGVSQATIWRILHGIAWK